MEHPNKPRSFWGYWSNPIWLAAAFVALVVTWFASDWLHALGLHWWVVLPLIIGMGTLAGKVARRIIDRRDHKP